MNSIITETDIIMTWLAYVLDVSLNFYFLRSNKYFSGYYKNGFYLIIIKERNKT